MLQQQGGGWFSDLEAPPGNPQGAHGLPGNKAVLDHELHAPCLPKEQVNEK